VQSSAHPTTEFSITSNGATGNVESEDGTASFYPGDEAWGHGDTVNAGAAPTLDVFCNGGSYLISLYDMPSAGYNRNLWTALRGKAAYLPGC
jgi:hypothetical protein